MNEIIVNVSGHGTYIINSDKVGELLSWLAANKAIGVAEQRDPGFAGQSILRG